MPKVDPDRIYADAGLREHLRPIMTAADASAIAADRKQWTRAEATKALAKASKGN